MKEHTNLSLEKPRFAVLFRLLRLLLFLELRELDIVDDLSRNVLDGFVVRVELSKEIVEQFVVLHRRRWWVWMRGYHIF